MFRAFLPRLPLLLIPLTLLLASILLAYLIHRQATIHGGVKAFIYVLLAALAGVALYGGAWLLMVGYNS
ncbi:hypothetical protein [Schleiferilactobacillus shenzhenensis]|uniref:hypothetical protein n=1 Tax=Schleiferilactobacillus shenzhenensis TaxID=1231337 RepID=UPI000591131F|nr:hypothetical protein [Schleiferilactobacillus shenzhenensis]